MNWEREMIERLKKYEKRIKAIDNLKERIVYLQESMESIKPVMTDKDPIKGGTTKQEDVLINRIMEKDLLLDNLKFCEFEVKEIQKALKTLTETEAEIINMFYINTCRVQTICEKLGYEKSQVYNIRNIALKKMTLFLYGKEISN